jgi:hypothetical protein
MTNQYPRQQPERPMKDQPQETRQFRAAHTRTGFSRVSGIKLPWSGRGVKIAGAIVYSLALVMIGVAIGGAGGSSPSSSASTKNTTQDSPATQNSPTPNATTQPAVATTPRRHVLIRFAGHGIEQSGPFNVGSGPLTITYSFNCASFGHAGKFQAELDETSVTGAQQPFANDLKLRGGQTTTVHPLNLFGKYDLSVSSECSWRIKVVGE